MLGQVYNAGSMPTSLPGQFAVHPVRTSGAESEGGPFSTTVDTAHTMIFTVVGNTVPAVGDILIGRLIEGRWIAERHVGDTTDTVVIAGCPCNGVIAGTVPTNLTIQATYGDGTYDFIWDSDLVYQPVPAWLTGFVSGTHVHLGNRDINTLPGDTYRYVMLCELGLYVLRPAFEHYTGAFGGPALGSVLRQFLVGISGNRCHKPGQTFRLIYGATPGGSGIGVPPDAMKVLE